VLTISHRLSTLGHVDEIIVLHQGRIVEHGTYEELKAAGGVFAWLLAEQNRYNLDRREDQGRGLLRPVRRALPPRVPSANGHNGRRPQPSHAAPRAGTGEGP
jgi:ABC-type multidrug transport system ATPase subunit